jgi:hypothetical protein
MNTNRVSLAMLILVMFTSPLALADDTTPQGEWRQLFNGKDLTGWKVKITGHQLGDNFGNTFRVEDGLLKVVYDQYDTFDGKFGHLFFAEPFSHYMLRVEYRFVGKQITGGPGWAVRNSGIMLHGQSPESMRRDQDFPVSIEVQLLGGTGSGTRSTANLCTPGTNVEIDGKLFTQHCMNSTSKTYLGRRWVTVQVEVHGGGVIKHIVDGTTVLTYDKPQLDVRNEDAKTLFEKNTKLLLQRGYISLQSESHPVEFRKVELMILGH